MELRSGNLHVAEIENLLENNGRYVLSDLKKMVCLL